MLDELGLAGSRRARDRHRARALIPTGGEQVLRRLQDAVMGRHTRKLLRVWARMWGSHSHIPTMKIGMIQANSANEKPPYGGGTSIRAQGPADECRVFFARPALTGDSEFL